MRLTDYFASHPVFTAEELKNWLVRRDSHNPWTRKALLAYHEKQGRLRRARRGLYYVVPPGANPENFPADAYLLAAKMTDDAILAYHTALEFHGKAYSIFEEIQYLTGHAARPVTFRDCRFKPVRFPGKLDSDRKRFFSVEKMDRAGMAVAVTSLERTLVDVLARPDLGGGWEEIWRSLEMVEFFDAEVVVEYALLLENATTAAKAGFFLEQHQETLMIEDSCIERLRARRPRKPHYLTRGKRGGQLVPDWNLVVPDEVMERSWEREI